MYVCFVAQCPKYFGVSVFSRLTPFHDTFSDLLASSVLQMKRRDLRLVGIHTQTVASVVVCQLSQCLFNFMFNFLEGRVLGCDARVVCVYETPRSI